ncbi:MAG: DJ-1/PfpI family protein [Candidatus Aenigmatarchaeota archaeon]
MKSILMVVAPKDFRDEELLDTKLVFERSGARVDVASTANEAIGMFGHSVKTKLIDDIVVDAYDALVLVGGPGAEVYFNNQKILSLAKRFYEKNKITAAICIAPMILANAEILKSKKATVWPSLGEKLGAKGAKYTATPVEKDGNIITANGPKAANDFAEIIVESL